jgi:hypothetical protein
MKASTKFATKKMLTTTFFSLGHRLIEFEGKKPRLKINKIYYFRGKMTNHNPATCSNQAG